MPTVMRMHFVVLVLFSSAASSLFGDGLVTERTNKVHIAGKFNSATPEFLLIFSAEPLRGDDGKLLTSLTPSQLSSFENTPTQVAIRVGGKKASGELYEYYFGRNRDVRQPWNNGREFAWRDWAKHSPDIWDNLCVVVLGEAANGQRATVTNVGVRRSGRATYGARTSTSTPNKARIDTSFKPFAGAARNGVHPVLNLAENMVKFRQLYYELGENRVLHTAYGELGQGDKSRYTRGQKWGPHFASWAYRQNQIMTPAPNSAGFGLPSLRKFFEEHGAVYSARDIAGWTDAEKLARIPPGSFVSVAEDAGHRAFLFTGWARDAGKPLTRFVGISGDDGGIVAHRAVDLPEPDTTDDRVFFAVPAGLSQSTEIAEGVPATLRSLYQSVQSISPRNRPEGFTRLVGQTSRYYLYVDGTGWHLRATSMRTTKFAGSIKLHNGTFGRLKPVGLESRRNEDKWGVSEARDELRFEILTAGSFDGFDFSVRGRDAWVEFDLKVGEKSRTDRIFIGRDAARPLTNHFAFPADGRR